MEITDKTIKALKIIENTPKITARDFAELMWPNNIMHRRISNQGNGACRGKAAWLCGGSYLGKLRKAGLIYRALEDRGYIGRFYLTDKGRRILKNHE